MADCCQELRSELAALRAEVAKLKPVDEERIINKSTQISQNFTLAQLGAYAPLAGYKILEGKIGTLGNGLDNLRYATNQLGTRVNTVSGLASQAKVATDSLGRTVIDQSGRLGRLGGAVTSLDLRMAGFLSSLAALNNTINGVLAKLAPLFNILGLVGALAGLASLAGILYTVFPRLDAHDRELDVLGNDLGKAYTLIGVNKAIANKAVEKADKAQRDADHATFDAFAAAGVAARASEQASRATNESLNAISKSTAANQVASLAISTANESYQRSTEAIAQAATSIKLAENAISAAKESYQRSTEAIAQASEAVSKANASTAQAKEAIAQAASAIKQADLSTTKANEAIKQANQSITEANIAGLKANEAISRVNKVEPVVNEAIQQISQVRPISEQALTNAFNALNKVNVLEPVANNAFTATQLQSNQLRGTQLEVTGLGKVTKLQDKKIVQLDDRINNFKPPTTSNPEVDKEALEKLTQVIVSVGVLKLAVDNLPRTIPASPNFSGAVTTAAIAANCRTAQPGGCTTRMAENVANTAANNAANKAANDLFNKLANLLNTGLNAAQLALLQPIYRTVTTVNTKLGAPIANGGISGFLSRLSSSLGIDRALNLIGIASNLHNAMMLSASLKVTLLEMLSSVGNATGLLQTSENENVDLNAVFNQGIETFMVTIMGAENYAGLKVGLRKYNAIYRAATNSLNATASMFNSIGEAIETASEYTGKIGNALRAASVVRENAYNFMAEKFSVKTSKFMTFQTKVGDTLQVLETVNEIAENIIDGQQQYTEAVKATADFQKQLADAAKNPGVDNKVVKEEAEKIKANLVKDPTGEDETGLLSFLTD